MSEYVISTRYANALMQIADETNSFERILPEVDFIKNTLRSSSELRSVLKNPIIKLDKKKEILSVIFDSHVGNELQKFLMFIVEKGRENLLYDVCVRFLKLSDEKLNQSRVTIISATSLEKDQKDNLKNKLEKLLNKNVIADYKIDPSIIGGFKAKFDDTIIDASIQHQLELLKNDLLQKQYLKN